MLNWQVGAVKITCIVETVIPFPDGSLLRDATAEALKTSPGSFRTLPRRMGRSLRRSTPCSSRRRD